MKSHLFLMITAFSLNISSSAVAGKILTLSSSSGDQIKAELVKLEGETAILRGAKNKEIPTPLGILSKESRALIKSTWKKKLETIVKLNSALGQPLIPASGSLWSENAADVAKRLKWPEESKTPFTSSYRLYTREGYQFAGAHPRTVVAYGDDQGKTEAFSLMFSNKGDTLSNVGAGEDHFNDNGEKVSRRTLKGAMRFDEKTISKTLTQILGPGTTHRMQGQESKSIKNERWDWNGHTFLLAHAKEEYVQLRIVKPAFADNKGKIDRISDSDMKVRLKNSVVTKENGDVYVDNIPMVDQGPKGYCAPATFERAMRHAGVPADMYLLATLATTGGGGTNTAKLYDEVKSTTRRRGGRTVREVELRSLKPKHVQSYIDRGIPILWRMCSLSKYNQIANARTRERQKITSWSSYAAKIEAEASSNLDELKEQGNYHICLIVGYNATTGEVAVSDSWGKRYTRRWVHYSEAEAVSNQGGYTITP